MHLCGFSSEWVPFVVLQTVWPSCSIIALFAFLQFLSPVILNVLSRIDSLIGWIVALCTLVWFLSGVNKGVPLQITSLAKWLVALWTIVSLDRTVGLLVSPTATSTCKCLGTLVTTHKTFDLPSFVLSSSLWLSFSMTKEITVNINCNSWSITFPKNSDNEIFTQPHLPKLKMKLVVDPDNRCYWLFD